MFWPRPARGKENHDDIKRKRNSGTLFPALHNFVSLIKAGNGVMKRGGEWVNRRNGDA